MKHKVSYKENVHSEVHIQYLKTVLTVMAVKILSVIKERHFSTLLSHPMEMPPTTI